MRARVKYATASVVLGAIFFLVVGDVAKFPHGLLGFGLFLAGVFVLSLCLYGRID
jgi:hypothetical protein